MGEINFWLFFCEKPFSPIISQTIFLAQNSRYAVPAQKIKKLFKQTAEKNHLLFGQTALSGLATLDDDKIIFAKGLESDKDTLFHEKFHLAIGKAIGGTWDTWHPLLLEESFAESYAATKLKSSAKQQQLIKHAKRTRKSFNSLFEKKDEKNIAIIVKEEFVERGCDSYPTYLHDLQYNAYLDLGINFFKQYGIRETIDRLIVAGKKIDRAKNHWVGVKYLNSKLSGARKIDDLLAIESIFCDLDSYLEIEAEELVFALNGGGPQSMYKLLASNSFEILLPELLKDASVVIEPKSFERLYQKAGGETT